MILFVLTLQTRKQHQKLQYRQYEFPPETIINDNLWEIQGYYKTQYDDMKVKFGILESETKPFKTIKNELSQTMKMHFWKHIIENALFETHCWKRIVESALLKAHYQN